MAFDAGISTGTTWTWINAGRGKGVYHIHAWANQQGAYIGAFETFGLSTYTLTGAAHPSLGDTSECLVRLREGSSAGRRPVSRTAFLSAFSS